MSFSLYLLYLALTFISPGELFPELAPYRITLWVGVLGLLVSVLTLAPTGKLSLLTLPVILTVGVVLSMMLSVMWAERWLGAPVYVLTAFGPTFTLFLLTIWNVTSLRRFRITSVVLVLLMVVLVVQGIAAYHFGYMPDKFLFQGTDNQLEHLEDIDPGGILIRVRGIGQMNDPNDFALGLVATLPLLGLAWRKSRRLHNLILVGAPGALLLYGVFLTQIGRASCRERV